MEINLTSNKLTINGETFDVNPQIANAIEYLMDELADYQQTFGLQHKAVLKANRYWQEKTGKNDVWEDLGKLLEFLMDDKIRRSSRSASYADAEATLKHIILGGIADGHPKPEKQVEFAQLKGKTLTEVNGLVEGSDRVTFVCSDGSEFLMYHSQDCCESVNIEDVIGDVNDLIGSEILIAEERTSEENPDDITKEFQDSFTWTFYEVATNKGSVTVRWYGESNGYYSESVDFAKTK